MTTSTTSSFIEVTRTAAFQRVDWPAPDPRLFDGDRAELTDWNGGRVRSEDGEIRQLARLERPDTMLLVGAVGAPNRIAAEGGQEVDAEIGPTENRASHGSPLDRCLHRLERARECHRRI